MVAWSNDLGCMGEVVGVRLLKLCSPEELNVEVAGDFSSLLDGEAIPGESKGRTRPGDALVAQVVVVGGGDC